MQPHTKIYLNYFRLTTADWIECEIPECGKRAVDIHHIERRGMGGSKLANDIKNLMALCRECHIKYGDLKQFKEWLKTVHLKKVNSKA